MKKIEILKKAVTTVVGIGTAKIVREIIKSNVNTDTTFQRVSVTAASAAIGGAVSDITKQYTDRQIDEIVAFIQNIRNGTNKSTNED
jgi:hypothetical protein